MRKKNNANIQKGEKSTDKYAFDNVIQYIDSKISKVLINIPLEMKKKIEEIRLRVNSPLMVSLNGYDYYVNYDGSISYDEKDLVIVSRENILTTFNLISNYSVYALEEDIKRGFITIKGGHRVGLAGKIVYGDKGLETLKDITSLNIRIAKEKIGISRKIIRYLINGTTIYHTLIISPPQCGKTTLLRDIVRYISVGDPALGFKGLKVGVVDERSELAATYMGVPQNMLGPRTDVLDGCRKEDGIIMLIRSMSPQVIATDELGSSEDIKVIHEALKAGVKILSTVHGTDIEDVMGKPNMRKIIKDKIFERFIILDNSRGVGTVRDIIEGKSFKSIYLEKEKKYVSDKNSDFNSYNYKF